MFLETRSFGHFVMIFFAGLFLLFFFYFLAVYAKREKGVSDVVYDHRTILELFLFNEDQIRTSVKNSISRTNSLIDALIDIPKEDRNFENTFLLFDRIVNLSDLALLAHLMQALMLLHPDELIRKVALEEKARITNYFINKVSNNEAIYKALLDCKDEMRSMRSLTETRTYCINEILKDFERAGVNLPDEKKKQFAKLSTEIELIGSRFTQNISTDQQIVVVSSEELKGLPETFIQHLQKTIDGQHVLTLDYPTYFMVMDECSVESTRRKLFIAFQNRGYPKNQKELESLIENRNKLAALLDFDSFASYDIAAQMAKSTQEVRTFLHELSSLIEEKAKKDAEALQEEAQLQKLSKENKKIDPWNVRFLEKNYKKRLFDLDEVAISEYFPLENTLSKLFSLYEDFFGITLTEVASEVAFYHNDLKMLEVKNKEDEEILGYLLLDLFPRPNKYSHAAHLTIVPAASLLNNLSTVPLSIIIANFPKQQDGIPSLLKHEDVKTFFHEFGHALHAIFGKAQLASFSGTNTKRDFVEMPSQMLEEWLYEPEVLARISRHYKTEKPLPNDLIDRIIKNKNLFAGIALMRQLFFAYLSLEYYDQEQPVNLFEIMKQLYEKFRPEVEFCELDHTYANFGHLVGYGSGYYSYSYSKVFALDLFDCIKYAVFDPAIGKKYKDLILKKGGTDDPIKMLEAFLGRKPSIQPFINDLLKA